MTTLTKKQAILQSLDSMNHVEMDQVLDYIKDLLYNTDNDWDYVTFKQEAMREIQAALKKGAA